MPPKNGSPSGVRKTVSGQPPLPVSATHRVHVDPVHVGPLLAVDLDVDEALVHQRRDLRVLERLVRHHVAPVAGRVADREQDRLVLGPRLRERLVAPREPVDRVGRRAAGGTGSSLTRAGSPLYGNDFGAVAGSGRPLDLFKPFLALRFQTGYGLLTGTRDTKWVPATLCSRARPSTASRSLRQPSGAEPDRTSWPELGTVGAPVAAGAGGIGSARYTSKVSS